MAGRVTAGQSLLTALAGLTAYQAGLPAGELLALGAGEPGESFAAAVGIAALLAEEVRRLGGDPDVILRGVYDKASSLAYS